VEGEEVAPWRGEDEAGDEATVCCTAVLNQLGNSGEEGKALPSLAPIPWRRPSRYCSVALCANDLYRYCFLERSFHEFRVSV
jgi:hypothetical protein